MSECALRVSELQRGGEHCVVYVRVCAKVCVKHLIAKEGGNKGDSKVMNEFAWLAVCVCACACVCACLYTLRKSDSILNRDAELT